MFASLAMSPDGTQMESKLKDCKRQVRSRVKQIKRLETTISKLKSKSNEVKTKIPLEINGKPGAIQGILGKIMNQVKDENTGSSDEKKRKKEVRDQIVMFSLNDSLNDKEKDSQYNMDEARMFVQGIREEIEKYAKQVTGKDNQIGFSPKVFQVAMKIWLRSPATYKTCINLVGLSHFQVSKGFGIFIVRQWSTRENAYLSMPGLPLTA
jgi:hypothetical protein